MRTAHLLPVSPSMHCSGGWTCWGCTFLGVYLLGVYLPGECTCQGAVSAKGDVPATGCTCWGVYPLGGVSASGVYLPRWVYLPGGCTCQEGYLPRYSPLWTEWQTGAKILPCPKLRLRAVIKCKSKANLWDLLQLHKAACNRSEIPVSEILLKQWPKYCRQHQHPCLHSVTQ